MIVTPQKLDRNANLNLWNRRSMEAVEHTMKPVSEKLTLIDEKTSTSLGFIMAVLGLCGGSILAGIVFVLMVSAKADTALASANIAQSMATVNSQKIENRTDLSNQRYVELTNRMTNIETIVTRIDKKLDR